MKMFVSGCLLAASAALLAGCHGGETAQPAAVETVQARVVESRQQQVPVSLRATGTIHATRDGDRFSAQVMGRIQQVLVREGDTVRAGQTLVMLDDATLRARVAQAQAGVRPRKISRPRRKAMPIWPPARSRATGNLQSQKEREPAGDGRSHAPRRSRRKRSWTQCARRPTPRRPRQAARAPCLAIRGSASRRLPAVVTARMADPGTLASPGVPLLQMDQRRALQLQANGR